MDRTICAKEKWWHRGISASRGPRRMRYLSGGGAYTHEPPSRRGAITRAGQPLTRFREAAPRLRGFGGVRCVFVLQEPLAGGHPPEYDGYERVAGGDRRHRMGPAMCGYATGEPDDTWERGPLPGCCQVGPLFLDEPEAAGSAVPGPRIRGACLFGGRFEAVRRAGLPAIVSKQSPSFRLAFRVVPDSSFHSMRPLALLPRQTAAAADGELKGQSLVKR